MWSTFFFFYLLSVAFARINLVFRYVDDLPSEQRTTFETNVETAFEGAESLADLAQHVPQTNLLFRRYFGNYLARDPCQDSVDYHDLITGK